MVEPLGLRELVIGTRGSSLAVRQAQWVAARVREIWPDCSARLKRVVTHGDRDRRTSLSQLGRVGVFTGELEDALRSGEVTVAVHSMKDLPSVPAPDVAIAAVPERGDPRDVLVSCGGERLAQLPPGAVVGTGSLRRQALVRQLRPDLRVADLRGNLDTRLKKVRDGVVDAAILAAAGLLRLGREAEISEYLDPERFVPAAGQGALAVQTRARDHELTALLAALSNSQAASAVSAERAFLARLQGGCQVPMGAYAAYDAATATLRLCGFVATLDGMRIVREVAEGGADEPEALGQRLAERLIAAGANEILEQVRRKAAEEGTGARQ